MFDIATALRTLVEREGSDLHIKVDSPPVARMHGELIPLEGFGKLSAEDTEHAFRDIAEPRSVTEFEADGEADFSYALQGVSRFRVNVFRQRGTISIVCRAIPFQIRSIEDLGLPEVVRRLADEPRGIVLVTGTTGSGKSTTLAAMIDHINETRSRHIITLEDPIEYLHADKRSIVNQREVGSDTIGFGRAMQRVLRQDPDVILIGEMRDEETVRTALSAAETGHLVLSTVHTLDATETINRIIDFFPPHLQQQARVMLAATLRGAIAQRLVPDVSGRGGCRPRGHGRHRPRPGPDPESGGDRQNHRGHRRRRVLRHADLRPGAALLRRRGPDHRGDAMEHASNPHDLKLMLAAGGRRASGIEQLDAASPLRRWQREGQAQREQSRPDRPGGRAGRRRRGLLPEIERGRRSEGAETEPETTVTVESGARNASRSRRPSWPRRATGMAGTADLPRPPRRRCHTPSRSAYDVG